jgi:hypothetical protein
VTSNCGPEVGRFALLQYLPAFVFHAVGMSYGAALHGLVALNGLAFAGVLVLVALVVRRLGGPASTALGAAVVLVSPLLWYSHAGFGEPLAAFVTTLFAASVLLGWPVAAIGVATLLAAVSKETAPPFLLVIALIAWQIRRPQRPASRAEVITVAATAAGAGLFNGGFNLFRYGTFTNLDYTQPGIHVPLPRVLEGFAGQLVSPNYGLVWLWPAAVAVLALTIVVAAQRARRSSGGAAALVREPGTLVAVTLLALVGSFSLHYAPYGGTATWGPRLLLPWIPALLLVCIAAYPAQFERVATAAVHSTRAFAVTLALLVLTGLPNLIVMVDSSRWQRAYPGENADRRELIIVPVVPDRECPVLPRTPAVDGAYYYRCIHHEAWEKGLRAGAAYGQVTRSREVVFGLAWALALGALLMLGRYGAIFARCPSARDRSASH